MFFLRKFPEARVRSDHRRMQRLAVAGGLAFVLAATQPTFGQPPVLDAAGCRSYPDFKICSNLRTTLQNLKPTQTKKWKIRVEGTREPVEIRLYNSTPWLVDVKGGPIVRTSGGRNNKKEIKITGLQPGTALLTMLPYYDDPALESQNIAAALAKSLNKLADAFEQQAAEWVTRAEVGKAGKKDARRLLNETENDLAELLTAYEELGALNDYAAERFRQARLELEKRPPPRQARYRTAPATRIVFADHRPRPGAQVLPAQSRRPSPALEPGKSAFGMISALYARLRAMVSANDLVTDLCVASTPEEGARFLMRPLSYPDWTEDSLTTARLVSVYRGLYAYRFKKKGHKAHCDKDAVQRGKCAALDLVDDDRPGFLCERETRACRRHALGPEGCPER